MRRAWEAVQSDDMRAENEMSININIFETTVNKTVLKTQYLKHRDITSNLKM